MFAPVSIEEVKARGWSRLDFVYVIGDAYVDHPSFGPAIITKVLEAHGYKVGIISQPDFRNKDSISILGEPRLGFLVSSGNMDSMVNHYYVSKKPRESDAYTPGGVRGKRPDRACTVYSNMVRNKYRNIPIIIGGIEASLRRMAHYDYWSDSFKKSVLIDSGADLISYGMGEHSIVEIADALNSGISIKDITFIRGTVYKTKTKDNLQDCIFLPDYESMKRDKSLYAKSFGIQSENTDPFAGHTLVEEYADCYVVQNPPAFPLTELEMDDIYDYSYERKPHSIYDTIGKIPAMEEIKFSIISNRGCFGGCNFCALTFHQGRIVQSRSGESIIKEAKLLAMDKDFKGYISDVGGPTANFRKPSCKKQLTKGVCPKKQCMTPAPCKNLDVSHREYVSILRQMRKIKGVKKVFIRSGIRFDYLCLDKDDTFFRELLEHHVSGQLKVAPEHINDNVLKLMGKPGNRIYREFQEKFYKINRELGKEQFLVPYLMSSHPGSRLEDAIDLAVYLNKQRLNPKQVQDFYPTPSTASTVMYYTGLDPCTLKPVYVERDPHGKALQRALIQYRKPENYELVKEALLLAGRQDLIGFGEQYLIPPRKPPEKKEFKGTVKNNCRAGSQKCQNKRNSGKKGKKQCLKKK